MSKNLNSLHYINATGFIFGSINCINYFEVNVMEIYILVECYQNRRFNIAAYYTQVDAYNHKKYLETFRLEGDYTVKFSGNFDVTMEVYKILSGADGVMVIFRTNYMPDGFSYPRLQKVRLVTDTSTGYKVPVGAVRVVNGKTGVYVLDGVTVRFCRIKTIYKSDAFYVVAAEPKPETEEEETEEKPEEETERWLRFHDNLIIEGKGLYDGRIIG